MRCDLCRRYAPPSIDGLQDVDHWSKAFGCSRCGGEAYLAVIEPIKEDGMQGYRLDAIELPEHHPAAIDRLAGRRLAASVTTPAAARPLQEARECAIANSAPSEARLVSRWLASALVERQRRRERMLARRGVQMESHERKSRRLEMAIDAFSIVVGVAAIFLIIDVLSQPQIAPGAVP